MSSRPFRVHKKETLEHLLTLPDHHIGPPKKEQIREELKFRRELASLDPEERLERPPEPKGTRPEDRMNKTEARYALVLDEYVSSGSLDGYLFEHLKVRVGVERDWYTVDFLAWRGRELMAIEVKGPHVREDAIEKFKAAALIYPWIEWVMVSQEGPGKPWEILYHYKPKGAQNEHR
ncbi:MAG: hypothetical protein ACLFWG_10170 [Longimicrobiales bacterium]